MLMIRRNPSCQILKVDCILHSANSLPHQKQPTETRIVPSELNCAQWQGEPSQPPIRETTCRHPGSFCPATDAIWTSRAPKMASRILEDDSKGRTKIHSVRVAITLVDCRSITRLDGRPLRQANRGIMHLRFADPDRMPRMIQLRTRHEPLAMRR